MNKIDYYSKYLKYKIKYLQYKQIGGELLDILFYISDDIHEYKIDSNNTVEQVKEFLSQNLFIKKDKINLQYFSKNSFVELSDPKIKIDKIIIKKDNKITIKGFSKVLVKAGSKEYTIYIKWGDYTLDDIKNFLCKKLQINDNDKQNYKLKVVKGKQRIELDNSMLNNSINIIYFER